ncbi:uncharacterized protein UTRI_01933_B [Ustilago trichophora]|uniref:Uncharacterized protein n=1 Tax=Ustilago trichophora TaxID=86804 RepID=A0A5C3DXL9_9BASI|nr:uncharacterized protein UTRI_01933_B [Ustilago trichophora]
MPSRRRLRGPLHPRNRPPPSSFEHGSNANASQQYEEAASSSMPPPSITPAGKKREWTATIGRGGLGSLPWEQMGPSSSGPSQSSNELPRAEFSFQSGMGFPTSTSAASMASMASMPSSSSASSFASFRQQQTPMSSSPSSFRTAADADESSYSARTTIFSRGNQSASAALRQTSQAMHDSPADDPPRKRRRGLAGTIVDTALNAALYTGAAALTAYSLWSSWGQSADAENQMHHPDAGPEADMGHVISQNKRAGVGNGKEARMPPGGLEEPPPPYYDDQVEHGTPSKNQQQQQQPSTPQSNSVRTRKVFVSSQRNRRRPTFQGSKTHRQGTPRKALPEAFRSPAPAAASSSGHDFASNGIASSTASGSGNEGEDNDDEDEDDEMLSRFEAKMAALIAEGQAALNSTPVLQESDLRDIDTPSPSLGIGMTSSRSTGQHLSSRASQRFDSPFATTSPFTSHQQQQDTLQPPSSGLARCSSHPDHLSTEGHTSFLPEPVKRTFATPTSQSQALRHSRSAFDFNFAPTPTTATGENRTSPFVFGRTDSPSNLDPNLGVGTGSPSVRAAGRRVTDFGAATRPLNNGSASPYSRIPRSTSTLQARKSALEPRPSPF